MIKKVTLEEFPLFFTRASTGTSFQAQIYSVKGGNNVRVRCNWRYSELTIDPDDDSDADPDADSDDDRDADSDDYYAPRSGA